MVPYRLAFHDSTSGAWFAWDLLLDTIFLVDIILSFLTGYYDHSEGGILVTKCRPIALNYLKGWFTLDVISTFPYQLIELYANTSNTSYNKLLRLLRLPRLHRLGRIFKGSRIIQIPGIKKFCQTLRVNQGLRRLLVASALVLFFSHLVSCLWFMIAKIDKFSDNTWVVRKGVQDEQKGLKYMMAMYWTIQTITTVGFGDIGSRTSLEIVMSLIWMVLGVGFYSYVIGNFSSIIAQIDQKNNELKTRYVILDQFQQKSKISEGLYRRIRKFIEQNIKHMDYLKMKAVLLQQLPPALKIEVMFHTHGTMIKTLHFYEEKIWNFIWMSIPMMQLKSFTKFQVLYKECDVATECFFIMKGYVALSTRDCRAFRKFFTGSHFGEYALLQNTLRTEIAVTETNCEIYTMMKNDFIELMGQFPIQAKMVRREAQEKQNVLMKEKADMLQNQVAKPDPRIIKSLQNDRISQSIKRFSTKIDEGQYIFNAQEFLRKEKIVKNPRFRNDNRVLSMHMHMAPSFKGKCKTLPAVSLNEIDMGEESPKDLIKRTEESDQKHHTGRSSQASYTSEMRDKVENLMGEAREEIEYSRGSSLFRTKDSSIEKYIRPDLDRFLLGNQSSGKLQSQSTKYSKKSTFSQSSFRQRTIKSEKQPYFNEQEGEEKKSSNLVSIIKQFNASIQLLHSGSYEIFSALNAIQNEENARNASINDKLDEMVKYQKELNERLL